MTTSAGKETKTPKKEKPPVPSKIGDVDGAGYTHRGSQDGRTMIETPSGKFGIYTNAWNVGGKESCLMRPTKDKAKAESVLKTGKLPEPPAKKPKAEKKADKKETSGTKAPKPEK